MSILKQVIEQSDTLLGRAFDLFIQALIVLSLISFSIETLPSLSESLLSWLRAFEIFSVIVFTRGDCLIPDRDCDPVVLGRRWDLLLRERRAAGSVWIRLSLPVVGGSDFDDCWIW
jgi:hypothetical protein